MAKIIKLTESDLARIVKRVIREEKSTEESKKNKAKEALHKILKPSEIEFLKQKLEDEGKQGFKDEVVAAVKDIESDKKGELSEEDKSDMSEDEFKLRSIVNKIIKKGTVIAGLGIVPAAMFLGGPAAIAMGITALLGVIFKDAAFAKRGGHHYAAQDRAERKNVKESYRQRQYRRRY